MNRPLRVFLCHSSNDKPAVRELYQKLRAEAWIQPWLDEEELYPGQDWNMEIEKTVEAADAIIVCLTKNSINKEGYVQRELRLVLDIALTKPEDTIFVIPLRLEECELPRRLRAWQYADYFEGQRERAFQRLLVSLRRRADSLELKVEYALSQTEEKATKKEQPETQIHLDTVIKKYSKKLEDLINNNYVPEISRLAKSGEIINVSDKLTLSNGMEFMRVPAGKFIMGSDNGGNNEKPQHTVDIPYDYWMARYPVTNELYNVYVVSKKIAHPVSDWEIKKDHPVVNVNWNMVMQYCHWLNNLFKTELPLGLVLRLPTEAEWEKAARGTDGRVYPWGNDFDKTKCNTGFFSLFGYKGTPVAKYSPQGDSPYGCADMVGNVREATHSLYAPYPYKVNDEREDESEIGNRVCRGGDWEDDIDIACCAFRDYGDARVNSRGFRVIVSSVL
jgi:formylglycine-generating enzyme required for sulfatase activity